MRLSCYSTWHFFRWMQRWQNRHTRSWRMDVPCCALQRIYFLYSLSAYVQMKEKQYQWANLCSARPSILGRFWRSWRSNKLCLWQQLYTDIGDQHAQWKEIKVRASSAPWITNEIRLAMNQRYKLFKAAVTSKSAKLWSDYKRARNKVTSDVPKLYIFQDV